jgi:hypothetical protein
VAPPNRPRTGLADSGGRAVKSLDADNVRLLKQVIQLELDGARADAGLDVLLLMGSGGRIFGSSMPAKLSAKQFALMERVKAQAFQMGGATQRQGLRVQVQSFEEGSIIFSQAGSGALLCALKADGGSVGAMDSVLERMKVAGGALEHILKEKGFSPEETASLPASVRDELKALSYRLFREAYDTTGTARKNREVAQFLRARIKDRLGAGLVEEAVSLAYNELGTSERFMNDQLWMRFVDIVVEKHVRRLSGDLVADVCLRTWKKDIARITESFV